MTATVGVHEAAERFERQRGVMFGIAYRMLGSVSEAEDVVQDAYPRWAAARPEEVHSDRAFLSTVVTRLCLDRLKSARARREVYVGPWLPEPLPTGSACADPGERIDLDESVGMAMLTVMERLAPVERAVFLLREVFELEYAEVAAAVGKREEATRQIFRRARAHIAEGRRRFNGSAEDGARLLTAFLEAARDGDIEGLTRVLADDITMWTDGGGKSPAALRPIHGAGAVARGSAGVARKLGEIGIVSLEPAMLNGVPSVIARTADGAADSVILVETDGERIRELRIIRNPDKLGHLSADRKHRV